MRKWISIGMAVVALLVVAGWLIDRRQGEALDIGEGSITIGSPVSGTNVDIYFYAPGLKSRDAVELVRIAPENADPGLEFVDARVYHRESFLNGVPLSWTKDNGPASDPTRVASGPIDGYLLNGESDVILFRVRIITDERPLSVRALRVTYRNGLREHTQVIDANYDIIAPRPVGR